MPEDSPVAVSDGDDLARARHHGVGIEAVLQGTQEGTISALALQPPAGGPVEEQDGAAAVVMLAAAEGEQRLDGQRRNGPLAHANAGVVGEGQGGHSGLLSWLEAIVGPVLAQGVSLGGGSTGALLLLRRVQLVGLFSNMVPLILRQAPQKRMNFLEASMSVRPFNMLTKPQHL